MNDSQVVEMTRASNQIFGSGTKGQRFESSRAYLKGRFQVAFFLLVRSRLLHKRSFKNRGQKLPSGAKLVKCVLHELCRPNNVIPITVVVVLVCRGHAFVRKL